MSYTYRESHDSSRQVVSGHGLIHKAMAIKLTQPDQYIGPCRIRHAGSRQGYP